MQIYRPGMGRFSKQRIDKKKDDDASESDDRKSDRSRSERRKTTDQKYVSKNEEDDVEDHGDLDEKLDIESVDKQIDSIP